jgi:hypothetical protein
MKGFKKFLTESNTAAELFEDVIVVCYNIITDNPSFPVFKQKIQKSKEVKLWLNKQTGLKEDPYKKLFDFSTNLVEKTGWRGDGDSSISKTSPAVSTYWLEVTGKKTSEPKTDLILGKDKISVKSGTATILSGGQKESTAIFETAVVSSGVYTKSDIVQNILEDLDGFSETIRSYGSTMGIVGLKDTPKSRLSDKNKKAKEAIDKMEEINAGIVSDLKNIFEKSDSIRKHFVFEGLTGNEKFGGNVMNWGSSNPQGAANKLLVWSNDLNTIHYHTLTTPNSRIVDKIAKQLNIRVRAKARPRKQTKSGIKKTVGYDIKQTIHMELTKAIKESTQLTSGYITEGIIDKVKGIWNTFINKISGMIKTAKDFIQGGFQNLMEYLGIEFEVQDNIRNQAVSLI